MVLAVDDTRGVRAQSASTPSAATIDTESADYAAGDVIDGRYRLRRVLGEGGMGSVWSAHHQALDVPVALKLIRNGLQTPRAALADRFLLEARLAARLEHESIIKVFDFGRTDRGHPFLVMELLHGEDLGDLLRRTRQVDPVFAVRVLLPVAEGVIAAHSEQIVHRDLKPDNIFLAMVGGTTVPKVLDFGIARSLRSPLSSRLTRSGACVGSPEYMAPEQAAGMNDVDARADIWAFCVVLYECVAGRPPFPLEDRSYERMLRAIIEEAPPTFAELGVEEPALWEIVSRGLRKDRCERCQTLSELGAALAGWLLEKGHTEDICGRSLLARWRRAIPPSAPALESGSWLRRFGGRLQQPQFMWPIGLALLATGHLAWPRQAATPGEIDDRAIRLEARAAQVGRPSSTASFAPTAAEPVAERSSSSPGKRVTSAGAARNTTKASASRAGDEPTVRPRVAPGRATGEESQDGIRPAMPRPARRVSRAAPVSAPEGEDRRSSVAHFYSNLGF